MYILKTAALLVIATGASFTAGAQKAPAYNIVFIGNSITYGATLPAPALQCPPFHVVKLLREKGYTIRYANCGHSGSTTVDFLPSRQKLFPKVLQAADTLYNKSTGLIFSITLGTNDSAIEGPNGAPVSPAHYRENLQQMIDSLHRRYPGSIFVLHRPTWYSPNTYNGARYLAEGLQRLQSYTPELDSMAKAHPRYIFKGDRHAYAFFEQHAVQYLTPEQGRAGVFYLHPNPQGAEKLAKFWADDLLAVMAVWYRNAARK